MEADAQLGWRLARVREAARQPHADLTGQEVEAAAHLLHHVHHVGRKLLTHAVDAACAAEAVMEATWKLSYRARRRVAAGTRVAQVAAETAGLPGHGGQ